MFKTIDDVPERLIRAYEDGDWCCDVPPVCIAQWDSLAWINHIGRHELQRVADSEGF